MRTCDKVAILDGRNDLIMTLYVRLIRRVWNKLHWIILRLLHHLKIHSSFFNKILDITLNKIYWTFRIRKNCWFLYIMLVISMVVMTNTVFDASPILPKKLKFYYLIWQLTFDICQEKRKYELTNFLGHILWFTFKTQTV